MNTAPHGSIYKSCKTMFNPEKYLNIDLSYTLRKQFEKLRCKHRVRQAYRNSREDRLCYFCLQNRNIIYVLRTYFMHLFNV